MLELVKNGSVVKDEWKTLVLGEGDSPESVRLPVGPVLVPVSVWRARRAELIHREYEHGWPLGVWLAAHEDAAEIARDVDDFTVIAVAFDRYSDGKAYATACDLRERYRFAGELRAIGDVPGDQVGYRREVGFDAVAVRRGSRVIHAVRTSAPAAHPAPLQAVPVPA